MSEFHENAELENFLHVMSILDVRDHTRFYHRRILQNQADKKLCTGSHPAQIPAKAEQIRLTSSHRYKWSSDGREDYLGSKVREALDIVGLSI